VAAVDGDDLSGDVPRRVRAQEGDDARHLLGTAEPTNGHLRPDPVKDLLGDGLEHLRLDEPRGDRVDRDADVVVLELVPALCRANAASRARERVSPNSPDFDAA
jgi:hypothetical protein